MDKRELRIGNLVIEDGKKYPKKVVGLTNMIYLSDYDESVSFTYALARNDFNVKPIEIDSVRLVELGFKQTHIETYENGNCRVDLKGSAFWSVHINRTSYYHIKYIHQLQNLYFAISGNELEF